MFREIKKLKIIIIKEIYFNVLIEISVSNIADLDGNDMRQEMMDWTVEPFERRQKVIHSIPLFQKLEEHESLNMTHARHAKIHDVDQYIIKPNEIN